MIIVISTGEALSAGGDFGIGGWTPVLALVSDGNRIVQQVVDFTGGSGVKPDTGLYVGTTGFVSLIGDAVNVRGATGAGTAGLNAWTAVEALAVDGERRVKQVIDWVGGSGDKPATGMYVGPAGYVALASQATDVRGAPGSMPQNSDALIEGTNNKFFTSARVRDVLLTGISFVSGLAVVAGDSVLGAIGKLQKQITDHLGSLKAHLSPAQLANASITGIAGVGGGKLYDENGSEIVTGGDGIIYDTIQLSADFESVRGGPTISAGFDVVASASGNITIYDSLTNTGTIAFTGPVVANVPYSFVTPRKFVIGLSFKLNSGTATIALRAV